MNLGTIKNELAAICDEQQDDVLTAEQIRSVYPPYDEAWPAQRLDAAVRKISEWRAQRGM